MTVIDLSKRRQPIYYTVRITHYWDDGLEVFVEDVAGDKRSRDSVADALLRAAGMFCGEDKEAFFARNAEYYRLWLANPASEGAVSMPSKGEQ